ncbi:MAG: FtsX-like permease family protein, partial [Rhodothermales bacterium]|nr:FtsX-like permease family protein [Rhodothermales bacterium]
GAQRGQLMRQFWGEAVVMTALALLVGLGLAVLALPWFNTLTGQNLSLSTFEAGEVALALLALLAVVGFVAGGYPAALLSRFRPAAVLKGQTQARGNSLLTRGLVVLQYTISIGLIAGTILMTQQLGYLLDRDLGYDDDLVLVVHSGQVSRSEGPGLLRYFRDTLLPYDAVTHIARAGYSFTRGSDRNTWTDGTGTTRSAYNFGIDFDYVDLMGMEVVDGRNFSRDFPSDSTRSVLVNEALVREFGLEEPVGTRLDGWLDGIYMEAPTIIGVVKDFNFQSLRNEVEPAVMNMHPDYYNYIGAILLKIRPDDVAGTLARVEAAWETALPGKPFSYSFLDEDLAAQYQTEQRWRRIVTFSSVLAVLIACLGLFGLATLSVARRTKEIGIRKVMGASVPALVRLIAIEFVKLVAVAAVIASPLAYLGARRWLDDFAYRIDIGPAAFVGAALAALAVALLTVSYHAVRAALADPVKSLRYE